MQARTSSAVNLKASDRAPLPDPEETGVFSAFEGTDQVRYRKALALPPCLRSQETDKGSLARKAVEEFLSSLVLFSGIPFTELIRWAGVVDYGRIDEELTEDSTRSTTSSTEKLLSRTSCPVLTSQSEHE